MLYRDRATAEECLQHPWLEQSDNPACRAWNKSTEGETGDAIQKDADSASEQSVDAEKTGEEESIVTEELIVVASYTLGQCRQSEKEKVTEQKAISKRFKFEEPLLQEIPGEFIYWTVWSFIAITGRQFFLLNKSILAKWISDMQ